MARFGRGLTTLVVALGLDAYVNDPLAGLAVTTGGFGRIGAAISELRLPTLLVQGKQGSKWQPLRNTISS